MSTIVRCRRREQLADVSYLQFFPIGNDGRVYFGRQWVRDVARATRFKYRENAEREAEYFREIRPGELDAYVYDLIDGGES